MQLRCLCLFRTLSPFMWGWVLSLLLLSTLVYFFRVRLRVPRWEVFDIEKNNARKCIIIGSMDLFVLELTWIVEPGSLLRYHVKFKCLKCARCNSDVLFSLSKAIVSREIASPTGLTQGPCSIYIVCNCIVHELSTNVITIVF